MSAPTAAEARSHGNRRIEAVRQLLDHGGSASSRQARPEFNAGVLLQPMLCYNITSNSRSNRSQQMIETMQGKPPVQMSVMIANGECHLMLGGRQYRIEGHFDLAIREPLLYEAAALGITSALWLVLFHAIGGSLFNGLLLG
ncbi:MAG: hypothetical protein ACRYGN_25025, partial [Janthinobacterium lividum]